MSECNNCNKALYIGDKYGFDEEHKFVCGECMSQETTKKKYLPCDDCGTKIYVGDVYYLDSIGDVICKKCFCLEEYTMTEEFIDECEDDIVTYTSYTI